jgi:hypothetical protein
MEKTMDIINKKYPVKKKVTPTAKKTSTASK